MVSDPTVFTHFNISFDNSIGAYFYTIANDRGGINDRSRMNLWRDCYSFRSPMVVMKVASATTLSST